MKGLIIGIVVIQFIGINTIPLAMGTIINDHSANNSTPLFSSKYCPYDSNLFAFQEKIDTRKVVSFHNVSSPNTRETGFFIITVNGFGGGNFFPPRYHKNHFFCFMGLISLSGFLSMVQINNETYWAPLILFFTGFAYVKYDEFVFRDSIELWGVSFHRPVIR